MMFKNPGQQSQFYMVALLYCSTQECKPEKVTGRELQKWAYLVTGAKNSICVMHLQFNSNSPSRVRPSRPNIMGVLGGKYGYAYDVVQLGQGTNSQ